MQINVIVVGLEPELGARLRVVLDRATFRELKDADEFLATLETLSPEDTHLMICGPNLADLPAIELAQSLKSQVSGRALLYAATEKHQGDHQVLHKNGCDEIYFLPLDSVRFERTLRRKQNELVGEAEANLLAVPLDGLRPGTVFDFDVMVFFPLNRKYVKLFHRGMPVRAETLAKLEGQNAKLFFIAETERAKFDEFVRQQSPQAINPLERRERLQQEVIRLFHGLLVPHQGTFDGGRALLDKALGLVHELTEKTNADRVLANVFKVTGQERGDLYDRALRVSTYASFFSLLLGVAKPEDMALAGLFHHVGLARLPEELVDKDWVEMTAQEQQTFAHHPELSLKLVKDQRLVLVPEVQEAIQNHHERPDGTGYPKKLPECKIPAGASLLALADAFDELTSVEEGRARLNAREAAEQLRTSGVAPVEMLHKLATAFKTAA